MPAKPTSAIFLATLLVALAWVPPAGAAPPAYRGASADGAIVFFESEEKLVPGDTDTKRDVYVRSFDPGVGEAGAYVTRQVSTGPAGGNDAYNAFFERASDDGSKVFFSSEEALVATDTDKKVDVYVRDLAAVTTTLVSLGAVACAPACGNGDHDAGFAAGNPAGTVAFLVTAERLDPAADTDATVDVYRRDVLGGATTLVSAGATACAPGCGNGSANATLRDVSADGSAAFFVSEEKLAAADTDAAIDIYARDLVGATTTLVSQGAAGCAPGCGNSGAVPVYRGSSEDGTRAFFTTDEVLAEGDGDTATDVYARDLPAGPTVLVSGGIENVPASFADSSAAGEHVFVGTTESLTGADTNAATDVYRWSGGAPSLVTSGTCTQGSECGSTFDAATADAATALFSTTEQLDAADTDDRRDIYAQEIGGGAPALISAGAAACAPSCGNGTAAAVFNGIAADLSKAFFTTVEQLAPQDSDTHADVYTRDLVAGTTTLTTPPPGLCPVAACPATFLDASEDGVHVFFQTVEWLVTEDTDSEADIYERAYDGESEEEVTRLVSTGNSPDLDLGPAPPQLEATDPPSPNASVEPAVLGQADPGSFIKLYKTPDCSGEPVATGSAEELGDPGLIASVAVNTTTSFRATAEAEGFASLCSVPLPYKQEEPSPPDEGGGPGGGTGGGGDASTPAKPVKTHSGGIAYVTPMTRITFGPAFKTRVRRPVFRFTDATGQPNTRFICKVDRRRWKRCGSPLRLKALRHGRHVFKVKAVNAVGVWEPRPSKRRFKLVGGER